MLEELLAEVRPSVVVLDTQRAIMEVDENSAQEVREAYGYLRGLANEHGANFVIAHHVRKVGDVSNSARERVSGSRDILAAADVHLALKSRDSLPVHALHLGKTRFPIDGVAAGTEWPIEARLLSAPGAGGPLRSSFIAGPRIESGDGHDGLDDVKAELLALVEVEGPATLDALNATNGNRKRAYESLRKAGTLVECGKAGRKTLYGTPEQAESLGPNAVRFVDRADRTREKLNHDGSLNAVKADRTRDRAGRTGGESGPPRRKAGTHSRRPQANAVSGQSIYSDRDRDRTRSCGFFVGPADGKTCRRCGVQRTEHGV